MKATLITTDFSQGLTWKAQELADGALDCIHQINVYTDIRRQQFQGFGGAFTEAAAWCYKKLPEEKQKAFMERYFGKEGLGYTLGRAHMNSCDFALGNYACMEAETDSFHTERDDEYLIPMILDAQKVSGKPIGLLLSPWSPPAFMKTNGEMNHGGALKPEYRTLWAECMAAFAKHYKEQGCDVRYMTVQNEPEAVQTWDSCIYTGKEEGAFAADYLAPALKEKACGDIKILAWDHNKELLWKRTAETLSVPGAEEAVSGAAFHWYTGDHFDAIRFTREKWPDKELWFTEGCVEYSRFDGMTPLEKAEMYAHDILGNLNGGISGSIDWNLLLDDKGGPNHVGNFCEAPIMLNEDASDIIVHTEYYYIGHFSRYIKAGATCLGTSVYSGALEVTAFENPDKSLAVVVLNRSDQELTACVSSNFETGFTFTAAPHSIATLLI